MWPPCPSQVALRVSAIVRAPAATKQPDGQIFAFVAAQITFKAPGILSPREGALAIVTNVGMGCGGRGGVVRAMGSQGGLRVRERSQGARTSGAEAYGEVVWS